VLVTVIIVCGLAFIVIRRRHGTLTRGIVFAYLVLLWASVALFVFVEHKYLVGVIVLVFPTMISWAAVFPGIDHAQRVSGKRILLTHSEVKDLETVKAFRVERLLARNKDSVSSKGRLRLLRKALAIDSDNHEIAEMISEEVARAESVASAKTTDRSPPAGAVTEDHRQWKIVNLIGRVLLVGGTTIVLAMSIMQAIETQYPEMVLLPIAIALALAGIALMLLGKLRLRS
jgi:hypothetical protein